MRLDQQITSNNGGNIVYIVCGVLWCSTFFKSYAEISCNTWCCFVWWWVLFLWTGERLRKIKNDSINTYSILNVNWWGVVWWSVFLCAVVGEYCFINV